MEVAGYEFGSLFSFAKTGTYPKTSIPKLLTVRDLEEEELKEAEAIKPEAAKTTAIEEIKQKYKDMSKDEVKNQNEALKSAWSAEVKSVYSEKERMKEDKVKLYWLIRGQLSTESVDKVKQLFNLINGFGISSRLQVTVNPGSCGNLRKTHKRQSDKYRTKHGRKFKFYD
jgi:hypothetical protein